MTIIMTDLSGVPDPLERVSNPIMTRIWNHIAINAIVKAYNEEYDDMVRCNSHFFDIMMLYNEKQCSGTVHLKIKTEKDYPENWLLQQVQDINHEAIVNNVEDNWFINDFRDFVIDKTEPLFTRLWADIQDEYPIDKLVNQNAVDLKKDWSELESFRGKYLAIRLAYYGLNTEHDVQITLNYIIDNEQPSLR